MAFTLLLASPFTCFALERFEIITTSEMQQLLDDRKNAKIDFILVNALDEMIHRDASIPGSVNIPLNNFYDFTSLLGSDINKLIIPY